MKTKICLLLLGILFFGCVKVRQLDGVVVNAIHLSDVNLTEQDVSKEEIFNWVYFRHSLYISDNLHKKIFVLNPYNRISFELGNIFDTSTQKQNEQGGWEEVLKKMQTDFSSSQSSSSSDLLRADSEKTGPSSVVRVNFKFENIGKIVVDNDRNLYVTHSFSEIDSPQKKMEILKFSPKGKFLYKIGAEGRDNPPFQLDFRIQNLYTDESNGLWIKYVRDGNLFLRYYSNFGKNILFFSEEKLVPVIEGYLNQNFEGQKYIIEDIFPLMNSQTILVVLDIYKEDKVGNLQIQKKEILTIDKYYNLQDIFNIPDPNTQIYGITANNQLYGFRYQDKKYLLEIYNTHGKIIQKSEFSPDISYYKRINLDINDEGGLFGIFVKSKDLVFLLWQ